MYKIRYCNSPRISKSLPNVFNYLFSTILMKEMFWKPLALHQPHIHVYCKNNYIKIKYYNYVFYEQTHCNNKFIIILHRMIGIVLSNAMWIYRDPVEFLIITKLRNRYPRQRISLSDIRCNVVTFFCYIFMWYFKTFLVVVYVSLPHREHSSILIL